MNVNTQLIIAEPIGMNKLQKAPSNIYLFLPFPDKV